MPVRRIRIPTPYAVGPVNSYLIEAEPLTLVDSGINTTEGKEVLFEGLSSGGTRPQDVRRIIVTHAHYDHYGLIHEIQDVSGATIHFPARELARVGDRQMFAEIGRLLMQAGMPLELLLKMDEARKQSTRPRLQPDDIVPIEDGARFSFEEGFQLEAHFMPGHSGGHFVYLETVTRTLFAGDQLLPDVSPNPLLEPSLDEPGERRHSLKEYLHSLEAMAAMDPLLVLPGHGDPVEDPQKLIKETTEHHVKRKGDVAAHLDADPKSPFELAQAMYPHVSGYDVFLSVSEVIAHLDLVVEDGDAVAEEDQAGVIRYRSLASS
ncbi:MAG: MBL fold metallo-hydrolase [Actinomycetota bacterium]|nr:MBL fold metallo-hydrolase [Actinomycetota bacterium]